MKIKNILLISAMLLCSCGPVNYISLGEELSDTLEIDADTISFSIDNEKRCTQGNKAIYIQTKDGSLYDMSGRKIK